MGRLAEPPSMRPAMADGHRTVYMYYTQYYIILYSLQYIVQFFYKFVWNKSVEACNVLS